MAYNAASHNPTGEKTGPVSGAPPPLDADTKSAILEASAAQGGQSAPGREHEKDPEKKQKSEKELAKERAKAEKLKKFEEKKAKAAASKPNAAAQPAKAKAPKKEEEAPIVYNEETPAGEKKILKSLDDPERKAYIPKVVESAWGEWWEKSGFFKPDFKNIDNGSFVIPIPPPNVTGALHIGHALANSLQDCLIRWNRMHGKTTLFLPGCDHAGISTQSVVENILWRREKKTRHDLGREKMVEKIWLWKDDYHERIVRVLKRLGGSYDWSREAFTMDANLSKAVTETFCRLHEEGYIYRAERLVNWCTQLQTAMSNLEVDNKELAGRTLLDVPGYERKVEFGVIITFKYPIEGSDEFLQVATTRIETMLGDTGIAVNPSDARYKHLVGKYATHPFIAGRKLKIVADDHVDKDFGTGAVKITPAHDQNDFEIGKRHNLEFLNIFTDDGKINANGGDFEGQRRFDARYTVLQALKEKNLYVETKDNPMQLPLCSRTKDIIEPILKPQWWCKMDEMAAEALKAVEDGRIKIRPDTADRSYRRWMSNIQPWCLSRQLWWGHQIPAYKVLDTAGEEKGWIVAKSPEEAEAKAKKQFPDLKFTLERDADVLDTWFSSGLWPFSTLGWPNNTEDMEKLFPTSVLETGWDILFFWVARMIMLSLKLTGKVPFTEVYCHSLVRDSEGRKMSKSLGNVIDPVDIMDGISLQDLNTKLQSGNLDPRELEKATKYQKTAFPQGIPECGSDALRFSLIQYTTGGGDIAFDVKVMHGFRRFCNKVYQASKFCLGNFDKLAESGSPFTPPKAVARTGKETLPERWILSRLTKAIKATNDAITEREFSKATQILYNVFYDDLCDVFIENSKSIISEGSKEERDSANATLYNVLETSLRLMHPFLPFVTEELWQRLPRRPGDKTPSIVVAQYPTYIAELQDDASEQAYELILGTAKAIRSLLSEYKVDKAKLIVQTLNDTAEETLTQELPAIKSLSGKSWSSIDTIPASASAPTGCAVYAVSTDAAVFLKLEGDININDEIKKAQAKMKKAAEGVTKQRKLIETEDFKEKVSSAVQQEEEKKLLEFETQQSNYEKTIQQFETMKLKAAS